MQLLTLAHLPPNSIQQFYWNTCLIIFLPLSTFTVTVKSLYFIHDCWNWGLERTCLCFWMAGLLLPWELSASPVSESFCLFCVVESGYLWVSKVDEQGYLKKLRMLFCFSLSLSAFLLCFMLMMSGWQKVEAPAYVEVHHRTLTLKTNSHFTDEIVPISLTSACIIETCIYHFSGL